MNLPELIERLQEAHARLGSRPVPVVIEGKGEPSNVKIDLGTRDQVLNNGKVLAWDKQPSVIIRC